MFWLIVAILSIIIGIICETIIYPNPEKYPKTKILGNICFMIAIGIWVTGWIIAVWR